MKKIIFLSILSLFCVQQTAIAEKSSVELKEKWVGVLWKDGEKPIVVPVLKDTEKKCLDFVNEMNHITKETVKIIRNVSCQKVMVK